MLCQSAAPVEPADGPFDDPSFGQDSKGLCSIGSLNDLDVDLPQDTVHGGLELRSLAAAIAILNVGAMDNGVQQQTLRVYQEMAFLSRS